VKSKKRIAVAVNLDLIFFSLLVFSKFNKHYSLLIDQKYYKHC